MIFLFRLHRRSIWKDRKTFAIAKIGDSCPAPGGDPSHQPIRVFPPPLARVPISWVILIVLIVSSTSLRASSRIITVCDVEALQLEPVMLSDCRWLTQVFGEVHIQQEGSLSPSHLECFFFTKNEEGLQRAGLKTTTFLLCWRNIKSCSLNPPPLQLHLSACSPSVYMLSVWNESMLVYSSRNLCGVITALAWSFELKQELLS